MLVESWRAFLVINFGVRSSSVRLRFGLRSVCELGPELLRALDAQQPADHKSSFDASLLRHVAKGRAIGLCALVGPASRLLDEETVKMGG